MAYIDKVVFRQHTPSRNIFSWAFWGFVCISSNKSNLIFISDVDLFQDEHLNFQELLVIQKMYKRVFALNQKHIFDFSKTTFKI